MIEWQLQEAKAKLSKLVTDSQKEPQIISRHGKQECVVLSLKKYRELIGEKKDLYSFFRDSPLYGLEIDLERDASPMREVKF